MLYLEQSLTPDETLVKVGHFHWIHTASAVMDMVWGLMGAAIVLGGGIYMSQKIGWMDPDLSWMQLLPALHPGMRLVAFILFLLGVYSFAHKMVIKVTTEIAVTNRRLIYKRGLVARAVNEIRTENIESVNVTQGILGRLLDYGSLDVRGTGVGDINLPPIEHPIAFKMALDRARMAYIRPDRMQAPAIAAMS
ncbi:MAG: PH domain-containing protein [Alphaproteobacteria bacterium]|nr:PH domain-containing protein [Alphaproteobacteria bacterium]